MNFNILDFPINQSYYLNMINDDFNMNLQSDEFVSEYENWLDNVYIVKNTPSYDWDAIHIEEESKFMPEW